MARKHKNDRLITRKKKELELKFQALLKDQDFQYINQIQTSMHN